MPPRRGRSASTQRASQLAHRLGLGVNAGHDLDLDNLVLFRTLPHLDEVSIGHAIVSRALFVGLDRVVREYLEALAAGQRSTGELSYDRAFGMKSDAIAFGVAGILFGLIAGWIIGSQHEAGRRQPLTAPPAAAAAAPAPPRRRPRRSTRPR